MINDTGHERSGQLQRNGKYAARPPHDVRQHRLRQMRAPTAERHCSLETGTIQWCISRQSHNISAK